MPFVVLPKRESGGGAICGSGYPQLFAEADIPNAHQLHKWVVDLEGANLAGFRMAAVALANPLEVSRLPPH